MSLSPTVARTPTLRVAVAAPLSLLLACAPCAAWTQQHDPRDRPPDELDTVVVEGRRPIHTVETVEQARETLDERAGATAVVDAES